MSSQSGAVETQRLLFRLFRQVSDQVVIQHIAAEQLQGRVLLLRREPSRRAACGVVCRLEHCGR